jgi:methionyl-tRNA formyltransferase
MQMDKGLDTGAMLSTVQCTLSATETGGSLHDKLAVIGTPALIEAIDAIATGSISGTEQDDSQANYAAKISKNDAVIDWQQPATAIEQKIRAFNPFPVAYTQLNGDRIKIWQASITEQTGVAGTIIAADKKTIIVACGEGSLSLQQLQLPGGKPLAVNAVMNSKADIFTKGTHFDS